jgi:hypothetical protein
MPAAGYKLFVTGDVLTAAQVNDYLMLQTVMVFANSAARTSALSAVLAEGLVSYLQDTNVVEVYTGAAWVSLDDPNAIQNSIVDAKGDLIAASADNTPARLAVGNNGETLVADSSATTGLRYQGSMAAGKNGLINGGFDIWQRGTSFTGLLGNAYGADRWMFNNTTGRTYSRQTSGVDGIQYSLRAARDSGQTWTTTPLIVYSMESTQAIPYAGKTVTLSYYAKAGANFSAASNALALDWKSGTGTDQNVYTAGYTGSATLVSTTVTLTTSYQRFSHTFLVASTATEIGGTFSYTPVGTAGANDFFEITGVQLEIGSVATNFSRAGGTIQGELAACQRYYNRIVATGAAYTKMGNGLGISSTQGQIAIPFPVEMRVIPTSVEFSTLGLYDTGINAISALTQDGSNARVAGALCTSTGLTQFRPYILIANANANAYLAYSAEL